MTGLRRIMPMRDLVPGPVPDGDLGVRPELRWVKPTELLVDESYQRDLGARSRRLIKSLIMNFAWRKMKPPIVVETETGLHVVDGQHTAIAAATRRIEAIPVFVVGGATLTDRADSFVAHNRDRIAITPMDIYRAKLASMDEDALDVDNVCKRAGVRLKIINPNAKIMIGDTASVGTIQRLVKRHGVQKGRMVLEALVQGGRAPISSAEIDAVEAAMIMVRPATTVDEMAAAVRAVSDHGVLEARVVAASEGKPQKHVLFQSYMDVLEKQTGVTRVVAA